MKKCMMLGFLMFIFGPMGGAAADNPVVTLMSHDSFSVSDGLLEQFEKTHGATVRILKAGDTGVAINQAILSKNNPLADVFYGVDNTLMSRAIRADIFEPYASPLLKNIPDHLKLDPENRLLPVDFGDTCLNYDVEWFAGKNMLPPGDLSDLVKPAYRGLTVVENPATSSPGLAFLLTTVGRFGEDGYLDFWKKLRANDVVITSSWTDAYYGQFTRAKGGTRPIVVSYASSPPAEVHYSETPLAQAPTAAVLAPKAAFRQIEFVGVLRGAKQPELARKLVDFMLGDAFQKDIPLQMWVFPANPLTPLPDVFKNHTRTAQDPVVLSPAVIEKNREKWIDAWTDAVLR